MATHCWEAAAQGFADATSQPSFLSQLGPDGPRTVLDDLHAQPVEMPLVDDTCITFSAGVGVVWVRIARPRGSSGPLPTVLYLHGGDWSFDSTDVALLTVRLRILLAAIAALRSWPSPGAPADRAAASTMGLRNPR